MSRSPGKKCCTSRNGSPRRSPERSGRVLDELGFTQDDFQILDLEDMNMQLDAIVRNQSGNNEESEPSLQEHASLEEFEELEDLINSQMQNDQRGCPKQCFPPNLDDIGSRSPRRSPRVGSQDSRMNQQVAQCPPSPPQRQQPRQPMHQTSSSTRMTQMNAKYEGADPDMVAQLCKAGLTEEQMDKILAMSQEGATTELNIETTEKKDEEFDNLLDDFENQNADLFDTQEIPDYEQFEQQSRIPQRRRSLIPTRPKPCIPKEGRRSMQLDPRSSRLPVRRLSQQGDTSRRSLGSQQEPFVPPSGYMKGLFSEIPEKAKRRQEVEGRRSLAMATRTPATAGGLQPDLFKRRASDADENRPPYVNVIPHKIETFDETERIKGLREDMQKRVILARSYQSRESLGRVQPEMSRRPIEDRPQYSSTIRGRGTFDEAALIEERKQERESKIASALDTMSDTALGRVQPGLLNASRSSGASETLERYNSNVREQGVRFGEMAEIQALRQEIENQKAAAWARISKQAMGKVQPEMPRRAIEERPQYVSAARETGQGFDAAAKLEACKRERERKIANALASMSETALGRIQDQMVRRPVEEGGPRRPYSCAAKQMGHAFDEIGTREAFQQDKEQRRASAQLTQSKLASGGLHPDVFKPKGDVPPPLNRFDPNNPYQMGYGYDDPLVTQGRRQMYQERRASALANLGPEAAGRVQPDLLKNQIRLEDEVRPRYTPYNRGEQGTFARNQLLDDIRGGAQTLRASGRVKCKEMAEKQGIGRCPEGWRPSPEASRQPRSPYNPTAGSSGMPFSEIEKRKQLAQQQYESKIKALSTQSKRTNLGLSDRPTSRTASTMVKKQIVSKLPKLRFSPGKSCRGSDAGRQSFSIREESGDLDAEFEQPRGGDDDYEDMAAGWGFPPEDHEFPEDLDETIFMSPQSTRILQGAQDGATESPCGRCPSPRRTSIQPSDANGSGPTEETGAIRKRRGSNGKRKKRRSSDETPPPQQQFGGMDVMMYEGIEDVSPPEMEPFHRHVLYEILDESATMTRTSPAIASKVPASGPYPMASPRRRVLRPGEHLEPLEGEIAGQDHGIKKAEVKQLENFVPEELPQPAHSTPMLDRLYGYVYTPDRRCPLPEEFIRPSESTDQVRRNLRRRSQQQRLSYEDGAAGDEMQQAIESMDTRTAKELQGSYYPVSPEGDLLEDEGAPFDVYEESASPRRERRLSRELQGSYCPCSPVNGDQIQDESFPSQYYDDLSAEGDQLQDESDPFQIDGDLSGPCDDQGGSELDDSSYTYVWTDDDQSPMNLTEPDEDLEEIENWDNEIRERQRLVEAGVPGPYPPYSPRNILVPEEYRRPVVPAVQAEPPPVVVPGMVIRAPDRQPIRVMEQPDNIGDIPARLDAMDPAMRRRLLEQQYQRAREMMQANAFRNERDRFVQAGGVPGGGPVPGVGAGRGGAPPRRMPRPCPQRRQGAPQQPQRVPEVVDEAEMRRREQMRLDFQRELDERRELVLQAQRDREQGQGGNQVEPPRQRGQPQRRLGQPRPSAAGAPQRQGGYCPPTCQGTAQGPQGEPSPRRALPPGPSRIPKPVTPQPQRTPVRRQEPVASPRRGPPPIPPFPDPAARGRPPPIPPRPQYTGRGEGPPPPIPERPMRRQGPPQQTPRRDPNASLTRRLAQIHERVDAMDRERRSPSPERFAENVADYIVNNQLNGNEEFADDVYEGLRMALEEYEPTPEDLQAYQDIVETPRRNNNTNEPEAYDRTIEFSLQMTESYQRLSPDGNNDGQ